MRRIMSIFGTLCFVVVLLVVAGAVWADNLHETQLRWAAQARWPSTVLPVLGPGVQSVHADFRRCVGANDHESLARAINNYAHQSDIPFWKSYTPAEIKNLLNGVEVDCTTSLIQSVPVDHPDARVALVKVLLVNRYLVAPAYRDLVLAPVAPVVQAPPSRKRPPAPHPHHRPARAAVTGSI